MRLLRLLAAALLLFPSAQTARAAQRVVSVPVALPRVSIQAPQLPNLPGAPVNPVLPAIAVPAIPVQAQSFVPQAQSAQVTALAQAQGILPQEPGRTPEQVASLAFDGKGPLPQIDALRPFRAGGSQRAIVSLTVAGWSLLAGAGLSIFASGAFSHLAVPLASVGPALLVARPFAGRTPADEDPQTSRSTRALVKRAQRIVEALAVRAGYSRKDAPKVKLSNSEGKDNAWASGAMDGRGTIGVGQAYARVGDEQLAGVLAHELGHLVHQDDASAFGQAEPAARYAKFVAAWALFAAAGALVIHQTWGDAGAALTMAGAGALLAGLGAALVAKASRLVERRADRFGAWLTNARWMAKGLRRDQKNERPMGIVDRIYSTHGTAAGRVAVLRRDEQAAKKVPFPEDDRRPVEAVLAETKPIQSWRAPFVASYLERALKRLAVPAFTLAFVLPMLIDQLAGLTAVAAAGIYYFYKSLENDEKPKESKLSEEEQKRLIARGERVMSLLIARLGLPADHAPKVTLSNGHGTSNASIGGRSFETAVVQLGDDWSKKSNRQLAAVLAHELGHVAHRDGSSPLDHTRGAEALVLGLSLASIGTLIFWELWSVYLAHDFTTTGLFLRVAAALVGSLQALAGLAAVRGASRLREHRADRFAAWLTSPRWLAEFFRTLPEHTPWFKTHPTASRRIDRLIQQALALGRNTPAGGPKGPGQERGSSLK